MTQLARESHAKMITMNVDKFIYYDRNGFPIAQNEIQKFNEIFDSLLLKAKEFSFNEACDVPLSTTLSNVMKEKNFSPIELDIFKAKVFRFEDYLGATYDHLSARHWDDEESWPGDNCYLLGGFESIIENLKKSCSVQLNTIVNAINMRQHDIEIIAENKAFYADRVIVTVPLGVLKKGKIIFNPPLPQDKQQSIDKLGMGLLNIASLKFPYSFWPAECHAFRFSQFDHTSISFFFNLHHFNQQPILLGPYGGERAKLMENFSNEELVEKTMHNLKKVFGQHIPDPEFCLNTRWSQDPFSYGSYSYFAIGASHQDCETLATSVSNRIFFAGEATYSKYLGTTHGAYLSGIREAESILKFY